MPIPLANSRALERRQVRYIAATLEDMIDDGDVRTEIKLILKRSRGEVVGLLRSQESVLSEHQAIAG